jgi:hypothetical protein
MPSLAKRRRLGNRLNQKTSRPFKAVPSPFEGHEGQSKSRSKTSLTGGGAFACWQAGFHRVEAFPARITLLGTTAKHVTKDQRMKKLFIVLLSSAALVACSDSGTGGGDTYDSTTSGTASGTTSGTSPGLTSGSADPGTMTGNASTNYPATGGANTGLGTTGTTGTTGDQATGATQSGTVSPTPPAGSQDPAGITNNPAGIDAGGTTR